MSAVLQVESDSRWDALALARRLTGYRWYLVEPSARRWEVRVALDTTAAGVPADLGTRIAGWLEERQLPPATIRSGGVAYTIEPFSTRH
jgi:hypothetical protein